MLWVPGAWELPAAARRAAATERYDALITLGAVIRGDTPHFDFVAGEASRGIATASVDFDVPIAFGLLTCDTMAQAEAAINVTKVRATLVRRFPFDPSGTSGSIAASA